MENARVFNEFNMKKDYDKLIEEELQNESSKLDSLSILLSNIDLDTLIKMKVRKDYFVAEQLYNNKLEKLSAKYTREVNDRLNLYIEEFSKDNSFSFILGSGTGGNVMYVDSTNNITDKIIQFINNKYKK